MERPQGPVLYESAGTGEFVKPRQSAARATGASGDRVTINLVDAPIKLAAKAVLADQLRLNYAISDKVDGKITLQTSAPIDRSALLDAFEASLKLIGATISEQNGTYWIAPVGAAVRSDAVNVGRSASAQPGSAVQIVPLNHISPRALTELVEPLLPKGALIKADDARNVMILNGSRAEIASALETIAMFDVDWLSGMSFAVVAVEASEPEAVVAEVEKTLGFDRNGPLRNVLRFIPNKRTRSVVIVAPTVQHIDRGKQLIERFDKVAAQRGKRLFVYKVRNRSADELAELLRKLLADAEAGKGGTAQTISSAGAIGGGQVAPRFAPLEVSSPGMRGDMRTADVRTQSPVNQDVSASSAPASTPEPSSGVASSRTTVLADPSANTLLVRTYPADYPAIQQMLEDLDAMPTQVLLEAVIAEVSLNDELRFGVKWHLNNKKSDFTFSDAAAGAISSTFPGFSYFFSMKNIQVALDALSGVTKINVVSAPSLAVMDGRKAMLQVGDQVPVVTQSAVGVTTPGSPVINSITMRDTGVILNVTPRVNQAGRVTLDVEQEVSSVARTTTSGIDSPTIQQRKIKTTLTVADGEAVALGGLIQRRDTVGQSQVPLLGEIPVLGAPFRQREDVRERTELIIFIRPQVMRDTLEARRISEEYRQRLDRLKPDPLPRGMPIVRDAKRLVR